MEKETKERSVLKKRMYEKLTEVTKELSRIEQSKGFANADLKVLATKEQCLLSHKKDLEELILICTDRNRF